MQEYRCASMLGPISILLYESIIADNLGATFMQLARIGEREGCDEHFSIHIYLNVFFILLGKTWRTSYLLHSCQNK